MLSLKINETSVDLPDDFSFTMNLKSPVFGDVGSYSYPFRLPNTARNAKLLEFRHRPESTGDPYQSGTGMFLWNGINLFNGTVKLKTLNNKSYEGSIIEGTGDFNYQVKNLNLRQIDFGELTFASDLEAITYFNNCLNKYYPDRNICFPQIANETYFDPASVDPDQLYFNRYINGVISKNTPLGNPNLIVPMMYIRYVLYRIFLQLGYTFDDQLFTSNSDYNKLALFNTLSINNILTEFIYNIQHIYLNLHVPSIPLSDFLTAIGRFFNAAFFVSNVSNTVKFVPLNTVLLGSDYDDYSKNIININTDLEDQIGGFTLKLDIDSADPVFEELSKNEETILKSIKGSVSTFADLPPFPFAEIGEVRYVIELEQYHFFTPLKFWTTITLSYDIFSQAKLKDGSEEISIGLSSLLSQDFAQLVCSCGNGFADYKDLKPRIFFAGYAQDGTYMFARNMTNNFGLFFNQSNNPFTLHWKKFLDFRMSTRLVKITRQMSFLELKDFDFSRKIMAGGVKYLVKSVQVTIKRDRILPAVLECYKCD